ncbi:MAG: hypothetical protein CL820_13570 [Croceicoccus sp.]|nr:hypothetical protein [Croceicoccus sp.]
MAWHFDNGPAFNDSARPRRSQARERVIRSAAYAPVAFGHCRDESTHVQNMRYCDGALHSASGGSA